VARQHCAQHPAGPRSPRVIPSGETTPPIEVVEDAAQQRLRRRCRTSLSGPHWRERRSSLQLAAQGGPAGCLNTRRPCQRTWIGPCTKLTIALPYRLSRRDGQRSSADTRIVGALGRAAGVGAACVRPGGGRHDPLSGSSVPPQTYLSIMWQGSRRVFESGDWDKIPPDRVDWNTGYLLRACKSLNA
jgi:hypothetical protein